MSQMTRRNPLLPWLIGMAIVLLADVWVAIRMFAGDCPAPGFVEAIVVIVIPTVYLGLMYLTLKSQA